MKRRVILIAAVTFVLIGGVWLVLSPREPVYQGKPLSQWVDECTAQALTNRNQYHFFPSQIERTVRAFGGSAVPPLIHMLEARHPLKERFYRFLQARKPQGQWAKSLLEKWSIESHRPETAAYFLGCIGPHAEPAIPALMSAVGGTNDSLNRNALDALGAIHRRQEIVAPFLARFATNSNSMHDIDAVSALGTFTEQPNVTVPALIHAISNNRSDVYVVIGASRLAHYGSNALPGVPLMREIAANTNRTVNTLWNVVWALDQIEPWSNADLTLPVYRKAIETHDNLAYTCILILYSWGPRARDAVPTLINVISKNDHDAASAAYALKAIDPEAAARIWDSESLRPKPMLRIGNPSGPEPESREKFMIRIRALGDRALPELIKILSDTNNSYLATTERGNAAYMLGEMRTAAKPAVPALISLTNNSPSALAALMKIRGESPFGLIQKLDDLSDWQDWRENAMALGDFGPLAEPAIPKLIEILQLKPQYFWSHLDPAVHLVGEIHRRPEICLPLLIPLLGYPGFSTRREAIEALGKFGSAARPAVPFLFESLKDFDESARSAATNALKQIDPEAAAKAGIK